MDPGINKMLENGILGNYVIWSVYNNWVLLLSELSNPEVQVR